MEIDGIKLQPGDRILLDNQTALKKRTLLQKLLRKRPKVIQNGIYVVGGVIKKE